jgi:hypothetical protein
MNKRDIIAKTKKFKGKVDEAEGTIGFEKSITLACRNDALDLLDLLESDLSVYLAEPLDALRRFIEKLPEAQEAKGQA